MESYFTTNKIPHIKRDIRTDRQARKEWRERYNGDIVPMIVFGDGKRIVDGCDIPAIKQTLRELGVSPSSAP